MLFRTVPLTVQTPLILAVLGYIHRLFGYSMVYTFESLKPFHFTYHDTRKYIGITDPAGWTLWEQVLVDRHLRAKETSSTAKRPTPTSF